MGVPIPVVALVLCTWAHRKDNIEIEAKGVRALTPTQRCTMALPCNLVPFNRLPCNLPPCNHRQSTRS